MEEFGIGAGLGAMAFWGFLAVAVAAAYWDGVRKRETQHETLRRTIESGQPLNQEMIEKLSTINSTSSGRVDRDFKVTAFWVLPVSAAMAVFAMVMGQVEPALQTILLGVSALLLVMGIGFLAAGKITERWYTQDSGPVKD